MSTLNPTVRMSAFETFADLSVLPTTLEALRKMDISTPTKIQAETLPILLDGRDVIGQSRTGSGKTLAFGIPAIEVVDIAIRTPQVLVLTPTRELAVQVGDVLSQLAQGTGIKVALVYGGRSIGPQISELRRGAQIVVGTPGRVADLYNQRALQLNNVRFLVLDEADEMLDRGFAPQVNQILSWTPSNRQTALFSATMPDWVNDASNRHLRNPEHVAVASTQAESQQIDHIAYDVPTGGKLDALKDLLDGRGDGQVIVFGRTKHGVRKLAKQMAAAGYPVAALQGNLSQNARDAVMADFRAGKVPVLLATNVAARGIDVTAVEFVINFELPESSELLSHRIGRTGRMSNSGQAITLLGEEDGPKWRQLERGLGKRIPRQAWTGARRPETAAMLAEAATSERRQPAQRPRRDPAPRTASAENGRDDRARRDGNSDRRDNRPRREGRADTPQEAPVHQPIRRRRSSISVISEIVNEQRGYTTAPPSPVRESQETRDSGSRASHRPHGGNNHGNGRGPRQPQAQDTTGRPSWGSRPTPRAERNESDGAGYGSRPEPGNERNRDSGRSSRGENASRRATAPAPQTGERHSATCSACGDVATLRFAPDLSRPIYCDKCYGERRKNRRPSPSAF